MKKFLVLAFAAGAIWVAQSCIPHAPGRTANLFATSLKAQDAPLEDIEGTIKSDNGKVTFVADKDGKTWNLMNPEAVKGHEGHHVTLNAHVYEDKDELHVMKVTMMKGGAKKSKEM